MSEIFNKRSNQHLLSLSFFAVLMILAFASRWIRGETLFFEVIWDPIPVYFFYPGDMVAIDTYHAGQFPAWDPFRGFGNSQIMPAGGGLFYPLRVIAYLLNSLSGWEFYLLLRFIMAGFFTYLFARTIKMSWAGAVFSGIAFMLCGYFREFHNFINLNIEALFPLEMLILLKLTRRPRLLWLISGALVCGWLGTGVHPEATFYSAGYCYAFFLFASFLYIRNLPRPGRKFLVRLIAAMLYLISVYTWAGYASFPFIEYLGLAWNYHFPGIGQLHVQINHLIALVTPIFDFWISPSTSHVPEQLKQFTLLPGYLGFIVSGLALLALLHLRRLPGMAFFFVIAFLFYFGIIFYLPGFSLVNHLPLFKDMQNFRYAQPFLAFSAAILAGFGLDMIAKNRLRLWILLAPFTVIILWIFGEFWLFRHHLIHSGLIRQAILMSGMALLITIAVLFTGWRLFWSKKSGGFNSRARILTTGAICLAASELLIYFILAAPLYGKDAFRILPPPPYVEFLNSRPGLFRAYGLDSELLHPNLGGLYKIPEIREQNPLYPNNYVEFFSAVNGFKTDAERVNHFLENGRFYFDLDLHRASPGLLDLINLRYILSYTPPGLTPLLDTASLDRIIAPHPHFFSSGKIKINEKNRDSIFLHAPSMIETRLDSSTEKSIFLEAGIMESAWQAEGFDGACLSIIARGEGLSRLAYFRFLDPKARQEERDWIPVNISPPYPLPFNLILASTPGPRANMKNDYTLYGYMGLSGRNPVPEFRLIYDRDCRIYENPSALERAFWVPDAEYYSSQEKVIERMLDKNFDPTDSVLLMGEKNVEVKKQKTNAKVEIERYEFGTAKIKVSSDSPGWLVLSDLYFPGWRAEMDGEEIRIHRAYFLFRAVQVPEGEHEVLFRYYPWPLRMGIWLSIIGMITIPLALLLKLSRKFSPRDKIPA